MRLALITALALLAPAAAAERFAFTTEAGGLRLTFVSQDGRAERFYGAWDGLPGATPAGAALFEREEKGTRVRLTPIGGGAPFWLGTEGQKALVRGSTVPTWQLRAEGRAPISLVPVTEAVEDPAAVIAAYRRAHDLPTEPLPRARVQAMLDEEAKALRAACGAKLKLELDWPGFERAGQGALPIVGRGLLGALRGLCDDKDYREAIGRLERVFLKYLPVGPADVSFELQKNTLIVSVHQDIANPAPRFEAWLREAL
jgi:hypothetical protein